ncbi:hypothetical protein ACFQZJ_06120 [Maribacter chungangensis]|uniref:Fibronectin type-III domain-containing protein n=1 Tax=Maribacter chungangensis TaxID=1069117 RepID=A0ABW3B126_9FLAO
MLKYLFKIVLLSLLLLSCSSSDPNEEGGDDQKNNIPIPEAATLLFPNNNEACLESSPTSNPMEAFVEFRWNDAKNADSYKLYITDLNTNETTTEDAFRNERVVRVKNNTPYSWYVESIARNTDNTANSTTWRFYNSSGGATNYAPYPAEAVTPENGSELNDIINTKLEWNATDLENDILSYEVFFGTNKNDLPLLATYTENNTETLTLTSGTTYYWRINTIDSQGNKSFSPIFNFKTN